MPFTSMTFAGRLSCHPRMEDYYYLEEEFLGDYYYLVQNDSS